MVKAGHIELLVTDMEEAKRFYVDTLGFTVTESDAGHMYLRGLEDRNHHSVTLTKSNAPGVDHFAFRVGAESGLDALERLAKERGWFSRWKKPGEEKGVGRALVVEDGFGFPVEFYAEAEPREWLLQKFQHYKGAKVMRLDHFNVMLPSGSLRYRKKAFDIPCLPGPRSMLFA